MNGMIKRRFLAKLPHFCLLNEEKESFQNQTPNFQLHQCLHLHHLLKYKIYHKESWKIDFNIAARNPKVMIKQHLQNQGAKIAEIELSIHLRKILLWLGKLEISNMEVTKKSFLRLLGLIFHLRWNCFRKKICTIIGEVWTEKWKFWFFI